MTIIYVISIKNVLSTSELLDSESVKLFFIIVSKIVVNHIVIDFSEIKQMHHSFALEYLKSKQDMSIKKVIKEICLTKNICKTLQAAQKELGRSSSKELLAKKQIIQEQLPS